MTDEKPKDAQPKVATATNPTVAVDIANILQQNLEISTERDALKEEVESLKIQLLEANAVLETDIRGDLFTRITAKSNYARAELEPRTTEDLQKLDADLSRGLGLASAQKQGAFKPISTAKDSIIHGTVPDLFGKDRATVLKELGAI